MNTKKNNSKNIETWIGLTILGIIFSWMLIPLTIAWLFAKYIAGYFYRSNKFTFGTNIKNDLKLFLAIIFFILEIVAFIISSIFLAKNLFVLEDELLLKNVLNIILNLCEIGQIISFIVFIFLPVIHWKIRKWIFNKIEEWNKHREILLKENKLDFKYYKPPLKLIQFLFFYKLYENKIAKIKINEIKKLDAIFLNENAYILKNNLGKHVSVIGSSGFGKTNTLFHFCQNAIEDNKPLIFIDGKGDPDLIDKLKNFCQKKEKELKIVSLEQKFLTYNPFKGKNEKQIVALLLEILDFSSSRNKESYHYKLMERNVLILVINILSQLKIIVSFKNICNYLQKKQFEKLVNDINNLSLIFPEKFNEIKQLKKDNAGNKNQKIIANKINQCHEKINEKINALDEKTWWSIYNKINLFYEGLSTINEDGIGLNDVLNDNEIMLFSVNNLNDPTNAAALCDIILQDLKQQNSQKQKMVILDEFGSFNNTEIITNLLLQGRSLGFELILSYQGLSELTKISTDFKNSVLNNTSTLIVHHINEISTAEELSRMFGTRKVENKTYQSNISQKTEDLSGMGTFKVVDEFIVSPNVLKNLSIGCAIVKSLDTDGTNIIFDLQKINQIV